MRAQILSAITNILSFEKKHLTFLFQGAKLISNLNITKNDYDEDGRNLTPYRELSVGARQW